MIGRHYSVTFENVAVAAVQDLFEITPADDKPVVVTGITLDNVGGINDMGDASEQGLRLIVRRGYATTGSGGSVPTPAPLRTGDAAAGFTAEVNNTTVATAGTAVDLWPFGWNPRVPCRELFPEELCFGTGQGSLLVVRLLAAPASSIAVSGSLFVCEMG